MPPKKQQQQQATPILTWNILPIIHKAPKALQFLKKPVNLKKTIDLSKSIQLLKQKGIDKYLTEGKVSQEGYLFICENLNQMSVDYLASLRKPVDAKKQVKKDSKKDSKKEQVVEQAQKTIELTYEKAVTDFLIVCQIINEQRGLQSVIKNGWKPDVVVLIEQKVNPASKLPNYSLLNNERAIQDFIKQMQTTIVKTNHQGQASQSHESLKLISKIKQLRLLQKSQLENTIIIEVPFFLDLQHPEDDGLSFIKSLFQKLCLLTLKRNNFESWLKNKQVLNMVPTIKQKVRREVVIEQKKQEKKGGKKEAGQPQTEIIQEIIEKKYEDSPQNIKSSLNSYLIISNKRTQSHNIYRQTFQNLALSISSQTQPSTEIQSINLTLLGNVLKDKNNQRPLNKIKIDNLQQKIPNIYISADHDELTHKSKLTPKTIANTIDLRSLLKYKSNDVSLQFQYKLRQFTQFIKKEEPQIHFNFQNRKYRQLLTAQQVNSFINHELQLQPKIYYGQSKEDGYNLLILARVNPPGRVMYHNSLFDWKVLPNFEHWTKSFQNKPQKAQFYNYGWKRNGNLKILNKKMMPSDNMMINESLYCIGDEQHKLITLDKEDIQYSFQQRAHKNIFSKAYPELRTKIYSHDNNQSVCICIQQPAFTVLFDPLPTIFWSQNSLESKRKFGEHGQIIRYLKNGSTQIYYPNGNRSIFSYGKWTHIKDNIKKSQEGQISMKMVNKVDGDKRILVREDETVMIDYPNGDKMVMFHDGTIYRHSGPNKLQILSNEGIIMRMMAQRTRDFNIIGSGSAFAYLGEKDILQRSYSGGLYQFHHPSFTWHKYTECNDNDGHISKEEIFLINYRDGSVIKAKSTGVLTFLHKNDSKEESVLHQRWLQLFTNQEYHTEGVYDVDLLKGTITTKDSESNEFRATLNGQSKAKIAVSFSIDSDKSELNNYGNGFHVPSQNYFLPAPTNSVTPRLFIINYDGTGQQILSQQQLNCLKDYKLTSIQTSDRNVLQFNKVNKPEQTYITHTFTARVDKEQFKLPNLLVQGQKRINLVPSAFADVLFRSIEQIQWDATFSNVKQITSIIDQNRSQYKSELLMLRKKQ